MLTFKTKDIEVVLNPKRGLALDSAVFRRVSPKPLMGTLAHGYYDDIAFGADFYTGHTLIERFGKSKVTDLDEVKPRITTTKNGVIVKGSVRTPLGTIKKTWIIADSLELFCEFDLNNVPPAPFYSGIVTLRPEAFDGNSLYYSCHNGGYQPDIFSLRGVERIDNAPVSFLVSSRYTLGNTEGICEIGDRHIAIRIENDMTKLAMLPRVHFVRMPNTFFLRVLFSLGEVDDTNMSREPRAVRSAFHITIRASKK